jgi:membrane-bound lytic murein transglycosylase D
MKSAWIWIACVAAVFAQNFDAAAFEKRYPAWRYVLWEYDLPPDFIEDEAFLRFARHRAAAMKRTYERICKEKSWLVSYIRETLLREDMSDLFLYMSVVESALRADAVSPKQAKGIWQFMPATAKRYALTCDGAYDEREDPVLSTEAAVAYLYDLYDKFGKWYLAVLAYNCGEGCVRRALEKAGTDDWEVLLDADAKYLPKETRDYLRKVVLTAIVAESDTVTIESPPKNEKKRPNKTTSSENTPLVLSAVRTKKDESLRNVAKRYGTSEDMLRRLNPSVGDTVRAGRLLIVPYRKAE